MNGSVFVNFPNTLNEVSSYKITRQKDQGKDQNGIEIGWLWKNMICAKFALTQNSLSSWCYRSWIWCRDFTRVIRSSEISDCKLDFSILKLTKNFFQEQDFKLSVIFHRKQEFFVVISIKYNETRNRNDNLRCSLIIFNRLTKHSINCWLFKCEILNYPNP